MCLGQQLPPNGSEWQDIRSERFQFTMNVPSDLREIISLMMKADPGSRPSADYLLKHPQLQSEVEKELARERQRTEILQHELVKR